MKQYDLIVIGGGRASTMAMAAGAAGKRVALIEKDSLGGTCPNRGCVPSKLLIGFAEAARRAKELDRHFITATIDKIDVQKMFAETNSWIKGVDSRYAGRLPEGVDLYRGEGRFESDHVVVVNADRLTAPQIVIGTGTRPRLAPDADGPVWTSDDIFPLEGKVPQSITIVGGGFIGCELANFFEAVGVETRLLVRGDRLLPAEDRDISSIFTHEFSQNVPVDLNTKLLSFEHREGHFELTLEKSDGGTEQHRSEALLFTIGRIPNTDKLGLENTQIELDKRGYIQRDKFLETAVPGVYAVGDVVGDYMLQHAASFEVNYLRHRILKGTAEAIDHGAMPHAVFSDPEVAAVGMTEEQAKESGQSYVAVVENWKSSAKAMASRLDYPRTKLLVNPDNYEILGCHLIGPESSTMIHQVMTVMHLNNDVRHLKEMIHIHPALPEALLAAAVKAVKQVRLHRQENKPRRPSQ